MGYTTDFVGTIYLDRRLSDEHKEYLNAFGETRRMKRDVKLLVNSPDSIRKAAGLPLGEDGEYFIGEEDDSFIKLTEASVVDYNEPAKNHPGLWCQWIPTTCGKGIKWDEGEKFYNYVEWMKYILTNFIIPWGYVANGRIDWQGEEEDDLGTILVRNNIVKVIGSSSKENILR